MFTPFRQGIWFYVEMNPVRAGLVAAPERYYWSSYRAHGFGAIDPLAAPHPIYDGLGRTSEIRQQAWREICGVPLANDQVEAIREHIRRGIIAGDPLRATSSVTPPLTEFEG